MKKKSLMIVLVMLSLMFCGCKESINLNDYLEIEIEGYDTIGTASYSIDYESLYEDYEEIFDEVKDDEMSKLIKVLGTEMFLMDNIDGAFSKDNALCNGDTIEFVWNVNKEKLENTYNAKFSYENVKETVEGLEEGTLYDPFEEVEVSFTGISPTGKVEVEEKFSINGLIASVDKSSGLKNGDTVTVTVKGKYGADVHELCFDEGMIPTELEKKYTVSGLTSYVEKLSEITPEYIEKMDVQARNVFGAHISENWVEEESLKEMELLGQYFLCIKPEFETNGNHNEIILVYRNTVENPEGEFSYYYYTAYSPIISDINNVISFDLGEYVVPEKGGWFSEGTAFNRGSYHYVGYETLDELFEELVQKYINDYVFETNISAELVAECKQHFIEEKGEFVSKYIINGENIDDLQEDSLYYGEVLNQAKKVAAAYFYMEKRYEEAYKLYQ